MLRLRCNKCGTELKEPAALVFGPPHLKPIVFGDKGVDTYACDKYHICKECWVKLKRWIL
jgi:hypothetical protein